MASTPLVVWLHGDPVAQVDEHRGRLRLAYTSEAIRRFGAGAIVPSVSLPVSRRQPPPQLVDAWVEGLLPEGESRSALELEFGVRRGDSLALLAAIGRDCAGAVSFLPRGVAPLPGSLGVSEQVSPAELAAAIEALPRHPLGGSAQADVRVSLGGLQAKLLLRATGTGWVRPAHGELSTHILKPDPLAFPGLVVAECFALSLARMAGIPAAQTELLEVEGETVLSVRRFDRTGDPLRRVHQEDGCQALGIDGRGPGKYENDLGTPSYRQLAQVLSDHSPEPTSELRELARQLILTVVVENTDGHAHNTSFLLNNGVVRLAPVYDVATTTTFFSGRSFALSVGGQRLIGLVTAEHITRELHSWGLTVDLARDLLEETLHRLSAALAGAVEAVPGAPEGVIDTVVRRIAALGA